MQVQLPSVAWLYCKCKYPQIPGSPAWWISSCGIRISTEPESAVWIAREFSLAVEILDGELGLADSAQATEVDTFVLTQLNTQPREVRLPVPKERIAIWRPADVGFLLVRRLGRPTPLAPVAEFTLPLPDVE